jgi:alcohol dehydrogenase
MGGLADSLKRTTWNFFTGSQLTFGPGAIGTLTGVLLHEKLQRVILITDQALVDTGIVSQAEVAIEHASACMEVFSHAVGVPSTSTCTDLLAVADAFQPDLFVAVGGGSSMDLAKVAAAAFGTGTAVEAMVGFDRVAERRVKLVCVPTTSGTGSEVSHRAIIQSTVNGEHVSVISQRLRPDIAIIDPQLTLSCPADVTAESGMIALTHAIEAYLVRNFYSFSEDLEHGLPYEGSHPMGDLYAEKAIRLIGKNLKRVVTDPDDLAARSGMALGATLAGAAFSSCGVSLVNALQFPLNAKFKCKHGVANAIVLPAVMKYWSDTRQGRLAEIAACLGVDQAERLQPADAANAATDWVRAVRQQVGIPESLSAVGATQADVAEVAANAILQNQLIELSPITPQADHLQEILEASF